MALAGTELNRRGWNLKGQPEPRVLCAGCGKMVTYVKCKQVGENPSRYQSFCRDCLTKLYDEPAPCLEPTAPPLHTCQQCGESTPFAYHYKGKTSLCRVCMGVLVNADVSKPALPLRRRVSPLVTSVEGMRLFIAHNAAPNSPELKALVEGNDVQADTARPVAPDVSAGPRRTGDSVPGAGQPDRPRVQGANGGTPHVAELGDHSLPKCERPETVGEGAGRPLALAECPFTAAPLASHLDALINAQLTRSHRAMRIQVGDAFIQAAADIVFQPYAVPLLPVCNAIARPVPNDIERQRQKRAERKAKAKAKRAEQSRKINRRKAA